MKRITLLICCISISLASSAQETHNILSDYLKNNQYQKALTYLDAQEPSKDILLQKVQCYKALQNYTKPIDILTSLVKDNPDDIQIKSELAACYKLAGLSQKSLICYNNLINSDPENSYFKVQKADILFQEEKYKEALSIYQEIYKQDNLSNLARRIGQCFEKLQDSKNAIIFYKKAWDKNPDDGFSCGSLINLLMNGYGVEEALSYSETFMKRDPSNEQINLLNGICLYKLKKYDEAILRFTKCHEDGDDSTLLNVCLGTSYYKTEDYQKALPFLEEAFKKDESDRELLITLATSYQKTGNTKKAIELYKELLSKTRPSYYTLFKLTVGLSEAYFADKNYEEAIDTYLEALKYVGNYMRMDIYYSVAGIYENSLKSNKNALIYYRLYKKSLEEYLESLKDTSTPDTTKVNEIENKLKYLNEHMETLEQSIKK